MSPTPASAERRASRPGLARRLAAGAWHVIGGFVFLLRRPTLWPLALAPVVVTSFCLVAGVIGGLYAIRGVETAFAGLVSRLPELPGVVVTLLLWTGTLAGSALLGLALALLLTAPLMERLSRRVERLAGGRVPENSKGALWEAAQALRGALYFLAAAPGVLLLNLVPIVGPIAGALWGAYALAHQLTDAPLTRRALDFRARRGWHREWRPESMGFGLAGLVTLVVPGANLLLGPALVVGGTLLVIELAGERSPSSEPDAPGLTDAAAPADIEPAATSEPAETGDTP